MPRDESVIEMSSLGADGVEPRLAVPGTHGEVGILSFCQKGKRDRKEYQVGEHGCSGQTRASMRCSCALIRTEDIRPCLFKMGY